MDFNHHSYTLDKGVHQGCPLSRLLSVIYMNTILHKLKAILNDFQSPTVDACAFIDDVLVRVATPEQAKLFFNFSMAWSATWGLIRTSPNQKPTLSPLPHLFKQKLLQEAP